jgi:hypothetical protein
MVIQWEQPYLTPQRGLVYDDRSTKRDPVFNAKEGVTWQVMH